MSSRIINSALFNGIRLIPDMFFHSGVGGVNGTRYINSLVTIPTSHFHARQILLRLWHASKSCWTKHMLLGSNLKLINFGMRAKNLHF